MITKDFHGYGSLAAIKIVDQIISDVRTNRTSEDAEFITGRGVIRSAIMEHLQNVYGIEARYKLGNAGVILTTIE